MPSLLLLALALAGHGAEPAHLLPKTSVLPLALDDAFQFRKTWSFINDSKVWKPSSEDMISFERLHANYGAVSNYDRLQRVGDYYTFYWRAKRAADVTVRFEYCQEKLGAFVQAQERKYTAAKGTLKSEFNVIGDTYLQEGHVTAWRVVLIENGKIVALNQSYLWR